MAVKIYLNHSGGTVEKVEPFLNFLKSQTSKLKACKSKSGTTQWKSSPLQVAVLHLAFYSGKSSEILSIKLTLNSL